MSSELTTGTIADVAAMQRIDIAEARIIAMGGQQPATIGSSPDICPVTNHFTPGLYCREIFMPAGAVVTSRIHRYRHPFVMSLGKCFVYMGGEEPGAWRMLEAPYFGITEPGTRRFLYILEDTIWTTFHVTDKTDVDEIVRDITIEYENPLLAREASNA